MQNLTTCFHCYYPSPSHHCLSRCLQEQPSWSMFPHLPFRYITSLSSFQWFRTTLRVNSKVLSTVHKVLHNLHHSLTHTDTHTHTLWSYLLLFLPSLPCSSHSERIHLHCSSKRESQLLPQGLCTHCSLPKPLFPQLLTWLYLSLLLGLWSNVTLSGKLPLTNLSKLTLLYDSLSSYCPALFFSS